MVKKKRLLLWRRKLLVSLVPSWYWPSGFRLNGLSIDLRHSPWSFGTKWLIRKNLYEKEERELLLPLLKPGMKVIEMGGSIGILTALIAQQIGETGRLVSVEASEKLTRHSRQWLACFPHTTVITGFGFPVWKCPPVQVHGFSETKGSLGGTLNFSVANTSTATNGHFDLLRICTDYAMKPDVLVVDVEGTEMIMMDRAIGFPASLQWLLIEFHPALYPGGAADTDKLLAHITAEGFSCMAKRADVCLFKRVS